MSSPIEKGHNRQKNLAAAMLVRDIMSTLKHLEQSTDTSASTVASRGSGAAQQAPRGRSHLIDGSRIAAVRHQKLRGKICPQSEIWARTG